MATYSLLGTSAPTVPLTIGAGTGYSLGTEFGATAACWVIAMRFYKGSTADHGTPSGQLYQVTSTTVGTVVNGTAVIFTGQGGTTAAGWKSVTLPSPVALTAGTRYRAAACFANGANFTAANNFWSGTGPGATNIVTGPVTAYSKANATGQVQGSYAPQTSGTYPIYPTTLGSDANYWVDVVVTDVNPFQAPTAFFPYVAMG